VEFGSNFLSNSLVATSKPLYFPCFTIVVGSILYGAFNKHFASMIPLFVSLVIVVIFSELFAYLIFHAFLYVQQGILSAKWKLK
jgi:hypothetical protein